MAKIDHPKLIDLLQQAYSAERAAAFAYIGHANSVRNPEAKKAIRQIEIDEWNHRDEVLKIMKEYDIPVSNYYEVKFYLMGRLISFSCHVIGWFMPYYFAGRLESGNVCEYFFMMQYFHSLEIRKHDDILFEMGIKEKEHEVYFLNQIKHSKLLPFFEKVFAWGKTKSFNDVNMNEIFSKSESHAYCKHHNEQENSHKSV